MYPMNTVELSALLPLGAQARPSPRETEPAVGAGWWPGWGICQHMQEGAPRPGTDTGGVRGDGGSALG